MQVGEEKHVSNFKLLSLTHETLRSFKAGVDRDWERAEWRLDWEAKPT